LQSLAGFLFPGLFPSSEINVATLIQGRKAEKSLPGRFFVATYTGMEAATKRRGRPRKEDAGRKEDVIRFRVTDEQRDLIQAAAEARGLDLSAWIRELVLKAADDDKAA
jgi:hypothetical protein